MNPAVWHFWHFWHYYNQQLTHSKGSGKNDSRRLHHSLIPFNFVPLTSKSFGFGVIGIWDFSDVAGCARGFSSAPRRAIPFPRTLIWLQDPGATFGNSGKQ